MAEAESTFNIKVTLKVPYKAGTKDFSPQAEQIIAGKPQAIFLMGVPDSTYQFMKVYNAPMGASQIYTLSFVSPRLLGNAAGEEKIRGMAISQVVPNPRSSSLPLVKEFAALTSSSYGKNIVSSPVALEAFLNIRLLVSAIKMAGPHPNSDEVMQKLAGMHNYDLGGVPIDFAGTKRRGTDFLDIAVVGRDAKLIY